MNTQNTTVTATSVNRPFSAICSFEVPTTELNPDFIPSVSVCIGEYQTLEEAKAACYSFADHPALIAMYVSQDLRVDDDCTATPENLGDAA
jgi:hypothetical protein